jgi:kumamolisin
MPENGRQPLLGSDRSPAPGAHPTGESLLDETIEVTLRLRSRDARDLQRARTFEDGERRSCPLRERMYIKRGDYSGLYGAAPADLETVRAFAKGFNLVEVGACAGGRSLQYTGLISDMNRAFGTMLQTYEYPFGEYLGREKALFLPPNVARIIEGVFGLDNRRQSVSYINLFNAQNTDRRGTWIGEIVDRYGFPTKLDGTGQCIAIIEFGGGISPEDLDTYFHDLGGPPPDVKFISVGAPNQPNQDSKSDREVALDIEVAGSLAPGAKLRVYFTTNDEKGWVDSLCSAVHDQASNPTVMSVSWGGPEAVWEKDKVTALSEILQDATRFGMTVCVASGDGGCAIDDRGHAQVVFPASSPFVLACGGTAFQGNGQHSEEVVWNDGAQDASGGGVSDLLKRPAWQPFKNMAVLPSPPRLNKDFDGRRLPDVAGLAASLYCIYVEGGYLGGVGGTSAVPALWAALIARVNEGLTKQGLNRIGDFNPLIYETSAIQNTFNDITSGDNGSSGVGGYEAGIGWDACTGWGTPNGTRLLQELAK